VAKRNGNRETPHSRMDGVLEEARETQFKARI